MRWYAVGAIRQATAPRASRSAANQTSRWRSSTCAKRLLNGTTSKNANKICTPGSARRSSCRSSSSSRSRRSSFVSFFGTAPTLRRRSPRRDCDAAPLLRFDVAHRLGQLPTVAPEILDHARTFAVLVCRRLVDDARTEVTGTGKRRIDVRHAQLDDLRDDTPAWRDLVATDVGDDDGAVCSDSQLSAVRVTDAHPFLEAERRL